MNGIHLFTDAEAAKGIASRTGLGKTRHIDVHYLWVQERVRDGSIRLHKVRGTDNPADLMTKHLHSASIIKFSEVLNFSYKDGRHVLTPSA